MITCRSFGHQSLSHLGMVVRVAGETPVVYALPETAGSDGGVRMERIGTFSSPLRAADVNSFRVGQLTPDQRRGIHRFLLEHVGSPFDLRFEYSTDDSKYCTELVLKALSQAGIEVAPALDRIRVVTVAEPAFAPDALRPSKQLQELVPTTL